MTKRTGPERRQAERRAQSTRDSIKGAAPWLAAIVVAVLSYTGAQGAVSNLKARVDLTEGRVTSMEVGIAEISADVENLQLEVRGTRREVAEINELRHEITRAVRRAIVRAMEEQRR